MALGTATFAAREPDVIAIGDPFGDFTWAMVDDILNRGTNALLSQDLGEDRRVAVFGENCGEVVLAHLTGVLAGCSTVPISFHLTADECAYILTDSDARVLFVSPETAERGVQAAAASNVHTVVGWRCAPMEGLTSWADWLADASSDEPPTDRAARPHLHYTSGTTGFPKGTETPPQMYLGGDTVADHVALVLEANAASAGSVGLTISPLYHTGPLSSIRALLAGARTVIMGRFDAEKTLAAIEKYKVTGAFMVPTHFQRLIDLPPEIRAKYDVSSLLYITHTGAACPVDVKHAMIDWFGPILLEAYGATEAGSTNMITSQDWLEHPGSVGKCTPSFEVVVTDDDGNQLEPNEVGHLYFRDLTGRGIQYHNNPEGTAEAHLEPGVFTMGEIGYVDTEGYVYITDRSKDMIVAGGVNLYPAEAEAVLILHPGVEDVAVIGVPDPDLGEQMKALVVPVDRANPPGEQELIDFVKQSLASLKAPKSVDFIDDLGRNSMGKVNKRKLRQPYWPTDRTIG